MAMARWTSWLARCLQFCRLAVAQTMMPCLEPIQNADGNVASKFQNKAHVDIALDDSGWPTSSINAYIAKIVLDEHMGYNTTFAFSTGLDSWDTIATGEVHVNLEVWPSEGSYVNEAKYVHNLSQVLNFGALGVVARNGWYVPTTFATEFPELNSYLGWQGNDAALNLLRYTKDNFTTDAANQAFFIGPPEQWAPTQAEQQIADNLNLPFAVCYSTDYSEYLAYVTDCLEKRKNHSGHCIFYGYFPSMTVSNYNVSRVGLPEYTRDCYSKAYENGLDCDYEYYILKKIAWSGFRDYAPDAFEFLQAFNFQQGEQDDMLQSVGSMHYYDIACTWITNNPSRWKAWIPTDFTEDPVETVWTTTSNVLFLAMIFVASLVGSVVLLLVVSWIVATCRAKRRFQMKVMEETRRKVEVCRRCTHRLEHPMNLVRADRFAGMKSLLRHEAARDLGIVTVLDNMSAINTFRDEGNIIVFISHQWLGRKHPDPCGVKWVAMLNALKYVAERTKASMENIWVWADHTSIPQLNQASQQRAVASLPIFAASAHFFVIVAPCALNADTNHVQDIMTYCQRMWCRAEQLSYVCSCGHTAMVIADEVGVRTGPEVFGGDSKWEAYLDSALHVFHGEASCCSYNHCVDNEPIPCDREQLVLPMLGLWAQMRVRLEGVTSSSTKFVSAEAQLADARFARKLESRVHDLFPACYMYNTENGLQKRELFGDLVDHVCRVVDDDPKSWVQLATSTEESYSSGSSQSHASLPETTTTPLELELSEDVTQSMVECTEAIQVESWPQRV